jgi:membrane fusion protein (multidrug efflux system)
MKLWIGIVIAAAVLVAFSCSNEGGGLFSRLLRGGGTGVPVTIESVQGSDENPIVSAPAVIEPAESVDVSLPEDSIVEQIVVNEGDAVREGDPVARLSEAELSLRVARLRADLREAQVRLEKDGYLLRNRDRLIDEERIDQRQYDALDDRVRQDESDVERIRGDIAQLEGRTTDLSVRSPIAGIVTKRHITPGSTAEGGKPIVTVAKLDPAIAIFRLPPEQSGAVRAGQRVTVHFPALVGRDATAEVTSVASELDPMDRTFEVKVQIPNAAGILKAGMRADVEFRSPRTQKIFLVPEGALIQQARGYFVFTVIGGKAHKVQVIPGATRGDRIEISRGLREDDMVVVKGQESLQEGTAVDIYGR